MGKWLYYNLLPEVFTQSNLIVGLDFIRLKLDFIQTKLKYRF